MKHLMESWVEERQLSDDTKNLFRESIVCYKADAFRASFLFSYMALLAESRDRVLRTSAPSEYTEGEWRAVQTKLLDESEWEKCTVELILGRKKNPFSLNDEVRRQVEYFKDRRNDCAHAKKNTVNDHHVEMLWAFIRSNMQKFVVRGGSKIMLGEIRQSMDPVWTPLLSDYSDLVAQLELAVPDPNLPTFFDELKPVLTNAGSDDEVNRLRVIPFLAELYRSTNPEVARLAHEMARSDSGVLLTPLITQVPQVLANVSFSPRFIRSLWKEQLWRLRGGERTFLWLLNSGRISEADVPEAMGAYLETGWVNTSKSPEDWSILERYGFFDLVREEAFSRGRIESFDWANGRSKAIAEYIRRFSMTRDVALTLANAFEGKGYPFDLLGPIRSVFRENLERYAEFEALVAESWKEVPERLAISARSEVSDDEIPF